MESEIMSEDNHDQDLSSHKSASDKMIEEMLLSEGGNDYSVLEANTELVTIVKEHEEEQVLEQRDNIISLSLEENCNGLDDTSSVNCLDVLNVEKPMMEGMELQIISSSNEKNAMDASGDLPPVEFEEHPSSNVELDTESADLSAIDDLGNYSDGNHVLIPKFEDTEDMTLVESAASMSTVEVDAASSTLVESSLPVVSNLVVQSQVDNPSTNEIITTPTSSDITPVNPTVVGVAELDGNIVSIGGQHFILFTGVSQPNANIVNGLSIPVATTIDGVSGNVLAAAAHPNTIVNSLNLYHQPPRKKSNVLEEIVTVPSVVDLDGSGTEHLVGIHAIQQNVVEVVEDNKLLDGLEEEKDIPTDVTQNWFTTRDDKYKLQSKGSTWKQGQWSKDENDILQENINKYCKLHKVEDPTEVIFEMSKEERKNFYRTIAVGLNRPLFSVYRRVIRMYDKTNHIGRYSKDEIEKLRELRKRFGSDWAAIGAELGRSASSVKDRCRLLKDQCYNGKWLPEEETLLANAVFRLSGAMRGVDVTAGLSWAEVAELVGTRTEKQCRTKWLNYLNWKQRGGTEWTRADDLSLIDKIANLNVADETHINWEQLSKDWSSVRSPQWLRGKWWSLKRTVPNYNMLNFSEIINALKFNSKTLLKNSSRGDRPNLQYSVKMEEGANPASILQEHLLKMNKEEVNDAAASVRPRKRKQQQQSLHEVFIDSQQTVGQQVFFEPQLIQEEDGEEGEGTSVTTVTQNEIETDDASHSSQTETHYVINGSQVVTNGDYQLSLTLPVKVKLSPDDGENETTLDA